MSYEVLAMPRAFELVIVNLIPAHRDRSGELADDLVRLGEVVRADAQRRGGTDAQPPGGTDAQRPGGTDARRPSVR
ncbi:hypothetical protein M1M07_04200 [Rhodococcus sp. HM1]|uniref:hypothetical protein n=1 Tax=unclassified Rhodococcus (in: high G+C Gram-positive bacteria) TaxID=192944 RepID=UPI0018CD73D3|nr:MULTISPECIES: hypothetical protein [unclassified Rhodococcus (in: high G+C Gram-positive bacteria)]MBH0121898.1 hypothetical protein [Rhodococcus sp. CX]MCK8670316.1 hypothetical protein [Rhodococcus sp. HM1]